MKLKLLLLITSCLPLAHASGDLVVSMAMLERNLFILNSKFPPPPLPRDTEKTGPSLATLPLEEVRNLEIDDLRKVLQASSQAEIAHFLMVNQDNIFLVGKINNALKNLKKGPRPPSEASGQSISSYSEFELSKLPDDKLISVLENSTPEEIKKFLKSVKNFAFAAKITKFSKQIKRT